MTTLGKIFAILNLVAAMVVGALLIMVYVARADLMKANEKWQNAYQVARAEAELARREKKETQDATDKQLKDLQARLDKTGEDLNASRKSYQELDKKFQVRNDDAVRGLGTNQLSQSAIDSLQREVEAVKKAKEKLDKYINDPKDGLLAQMDKLRQEKVTAEIERNSLKVRNGELQGRVEDMAKQIVKLQTPAGSGSVTGTGSRPVRNPPTTDVEGVVLSVDKDTGYVTLSVGGDSGLTKGHTLELFRLSNVRGQSKYLGTLEILKVGPKQAVGRPVQRMLGTVETGDQVSSRVLDG